MNLSERCIKRPVFTVVISLVLILLGVLGFTQLSLRSDPQVFRPRISIRVQVPGATPLFVEKNVTTPLENALQTISGVTFMESRSEQNVAMITLHFKGITQQEFLTAQSQVNQSIAMQSLPESAQKPVIYSGGGDSGSQVMFLAVEGKHVPQQVLVDYVRNNIVRRLEQVPGVALANVWATTNALRIDLHPKTMALLGVSIDDIKQALQNNNVAISGGQVINKQQVIPINLGSRLQSIKNYQNIIIKRTHRRVIFLKDVAGMRISTATLGGAFTYYNGREGAAVGVVAADSANPIAVGKRLRAAIARLNMTLPVGMKIHVVWDNAILLQKAVEELYVTIFEAVFLVGLITFLFLGNLQLTKIPVVTIPVCLIASFVVMLILGFSINMMTLLALVLAVGLVVDDAIVVLENCYRHVEEGLPAFQAAIKSMKEVTFPIIGMTVSIAAVYLPTAFMRGKTAVYFQQFAFTLAGAVLISGLVALTLTPMMCARITLVQGRSGYAGFIDKVFAKFRAGYSRFLNVILRHRIWVAVIFFVLLGAGVYGFRLLPSNLMPKQYAGMAFSQINGPNTASITYLKKHAKKVIDDIARDPLVSGVVSFGGGESAGSSTAFNLIKFKPSVRTTQQNVQAAATLQARFSKMTGVSVAVQPININTHGSGGSNNPSAVEFFLRGFVNFDELQAAANHFTKVLRSSGKFDMVNSSADATNEQYNIHIDQAMVNAMSVPVESVNSALSMYLGGYTIPDGFAFGGVMYPVIVQLPVEQLKNIDVLHTLFVFNSFHQPIALSELVKTSLTNALSMRAHINGMRSVAFNALVKPQYSGGQVVKMLETLGQRSLPSGVSVSFSQHFLDLISGNQTMLMIFSLGLLFIYLVLAALFESFIDPLIILFTVPLCVVGAIFALIAIGGSINIFTGIGLVTLIGLVTKHGVLITHFSNELRKQGQPLLEAVKHAAKMRLRPILMTTATMIIGALPLLLSSGVGSVARVQVGTVIIAGLVVGTFFSLVVVPVVYTLLARFHRIHSVQTEDE